MTVAPDGVARCFIRINVPRTKQERIDDARAVLAELPTDRKQRAEATLAELRKLNHTLNESQLWCSLMKELADLGADAVPAICRELDATEQQWMMRP